MQDRPTQDELLAAVERFLADEIVPNIEGSRGFHARVASNVLGIIRRELANEEEHLDQEWAGLDAILGPAERPRNRDELLEALAARNKELCERISRGDADGDPLREAVFAHARRTVRDKLLVTNPGWLGE